MKPAKYYPPFFSFSHIVGTWFGTGRFPWAPGTIGSLAALPFAWAIQWGGQYLDQGWSRHGALFIAAFILFWVGLVASNRYIAETGRNDPKEIVVDEVVGLWIAVLFARPDAIWLYAVGFVFFRIFDIWKPWPVSWADSDLPRGWGVMIDDVLAGIYATILVYGIATLYESPDVRAFFN